VYIGLIKRAFGNLWPSDSERQTAKRQELPRLMDGLDKLAATANDLEFRSKLSSLPLEHVLDDCLNRLSYWQRNWKEVSTCQICFENTPAKFMGYGGVQDGCGHSALFCSVCLNQYATERLDAGAVSTEGLSCPASGCDRALPLACTANVLSKEQNSKLQCLRRNAIISADPNLRWCPQPNCETVIDTSKLNRSCFSDLSTCFASTVGLFAPVVIAPSAQCPKCTKLICLHCGAEWHEGRCEDAADKKLSELVEKMGWKRCPFCKKVVERTEGCNEMRCHHLGCGKTFCYGCATSPCSC